MLIGYVSDEKYVGLADVAVEFTNADRFTPICRRAITPSRL